MDKGGSRGRRQAEDAMGMVEVRWRLMDGLEGRWWWASGGGEE
jgi:hypothetical protein